MKDNLGFYDVYPYKKDEQESLDQRELAIAREDNGEDIPDLMASPEPLNEFQKELARTSAEYMCPIINMPCPTKKCYFWYEDGGCAYTSGAEAMDRIAKSMQNIDRTLLKILGHLKTNL